MNMATNELTGVLWATNVRRALIDLTVSKNLLMLFRAVYCEGDSLYRYVNLEF